MAKKSAVVLAAAASLQGVHAFAFGTGSLPGLRARGGVSALAMSEHDKCDQVLPRDVPQAHFKSNTKLYIHCRSHCTFQRMSSAASIRLHLLPCRLCLCVCMHSALINPGTLGYRRRVWKGQGEQPACCFLAWHGSFRACLLAL